MGTIFFSLILTGVLLNTIFTGFTTLNTIFLAVCLVLIIYSLRFSKNLLKKVGSPRKELMINAAVYGVFCAALITYGLLLPASQQSDTSAQIDKSNTLIRADNIKEAEKLLLVLQKKAANNPAVNQNLAVVYLRKGQLDQAKKYLDLAANKAMQDENWWYNYGTYYYQSKDYKNALVSFAKAIELNPNMTLAYAHAGKASLNLRELRKAIYYLEGAKFLAPNSATVLFNLGRANVELMQYKPAEEYFNEALALKPDTEMQTKLKDELKLLASYQEVK